MDWRKPDSAKKRSRINAYTVQAFPNTHAESETVCVIPIF